MALVGVALCQCSFYQSTVLDSYIHSAQEDFHNHKYESAVTKYQYLFHHHPESDKKQYFLFQKGLSLYLLRSYHDAEKTFKEYLDLYHDGLYQAESNAYLTKIEALRAEREKNYVLQREEIKGNVDLLRLMVERNPYDAQVHYELANHLWDLGDYNEAAKHYLKAGEIDAALKESELIKNRLMINGQGDVIPITPALQRELEREKNPLVVFDVHSYQQRTKPDYLGASKAFQTVSGKVRNQSKQAIHRVSIAVNFYNVRHELLDTQNFYVGTMGPQEVRAFLVKGQNFDNLYNIDHFECLSYYNQ
ncbi:tetratricopeptide repeat protein [Candidatus Sumerlaeota bacterium]|nr:tetratricopeptide repeat protein [Candidatus Sumerlaeota bacterium]